MRSLRLGAAFAAVALISFGLGWWMAPSDPDAHRPNEPATVAPQVPAGAPALERVVVASSEIPAPVVIPVGVTGPATADAGGGPDTPVIADQPPLPKCRPRIALAPDMAAKSISGPKMALEFVNDCDETVTWSWVNLDGKEQPPNVIWAKSASTIRS